MTSERDSRSAPGPFVKERRRAPEGSIPVVLGMFESEVRFYREIAPVVGVRVPSCVSAEMTATGTRIELEDLSAWNGETDPVRVAETLREMHDHWAPTAEARWPWLRRAGLAADLIGDLYDREWRMLAQRPLPQSVRDLGERLFGKVEDAERAEAAIAPHTLVHGDASTSNVRTSPGGEVAFLDWEDVRLGPGVADLAWLLVSSVEPGQWDDVIAAYGDAPNLVEAMPAAAAQGMSCLAGEAAESGDAWCRRLERAAKFL